MQPEVQHVVITLADGTVHVMLYVTNDYRGNIRPPTDPNIAEAIEQMYGEREEVPVSWRRVQLHELPTDRTFRNAWHDTGKVEVNMERARDIHRSNLRLLREPLLRELDVKYQQADERADKQEKRRVAERKQALRDITQHSEIEAAQTPDELKAAALSVLGV